MTYHTVKDFVAYKISGKQQSPIGTSVYSDKNPILVDKLSSKEGLSIISSYLV